MTSYLFDTNAAISLLDGAVSYERWVDTPTAVSVLTDAELRRGLAVHAENPVVSLRRQHVLTLLNTTWVPLPVDAHVTAAYARVVRAVVDSGQQPRARTIDHLIAATALAHGMTLVTADRRLINGIRSVVTVESLDGG